MNLSDFKAKYPLFAFDLTADELITDESGAFSLIKRGNAWFQLQFKQTLDDSIYMLVFGQFDNLIQIDSNRAIHTDY